MEGGTNLNELIDSGMFRLDNANTNAPAGYEWGQLLVVHGGADTIAQMIFDHSASEVSLRTGNPAEVGGTGTWQDWAKIWTDKNDGPGTGLNADLLDNYHASHFAPQSTTYNKSEIDADFATKLLTYTRTQVDGLISDVEALDGVNAENGWVKLSNGLIFQWGRVISTSDSPETFTFLHEFEHLCFNVFTTRNRSGGVDSLNVKSVSTTSFVVDRNDDMKDDNPFFYFSIGY